MNQCQIAFVKTHPNARLPERNHKQSLTGDTGYDVYAVEDAIIPANGTGNIVVGLDIADIEEGYWIRVESRSGMFFKHGITSFSGIIDCSYRGKLGIGLINNSSNAYHVKAGDRVSQLVVYKLIEPHIIWKAYKEDSLRGDKGFGSSGR